MAKLLNLKILGDDRGSLISLEQNKNIPFDIKRIYYIFNTKEDVRRGFHAHRNLEQVLICVSGRCKILVDDGHSKEDILLDSPDIGLLISGLVWREMFDFSSDCVLMVLASELYDESDYIRDYDDFLREVNNA
ncbi:dTDP-6-deoxy-3,4-keto-hexulose isomerase [Francisella philomiragia]|uniref:sugar 3,4-ketoisomerase n=1 Tax=Francisella philomiragia TaxID=28110 RepID=UPI0005A569F3|nr:FdtA/QdtA family cupin domain-containing protein [Francisella philomiragia]AJI57348.1 dTDP-6-deoxy-3,4-keto-hexulose isomerase [Francisella philomiragia]